MKEKILIHYFKEGVGHISAKIGNQYFSLHPNKQKVISFLNTRTDVPGFKGVPVNIYKCQNILSDFSSYCKKYGKPYYSFYINVPKQKPLSKDAFIPDYYQLADSKLGKNDRYNCMDLVKGAIADSSCPIFKKKVFKMNKTSTKTFSEELKANNYV